MALSGKLGMFFLNSRCFASKSICKSYYHLWNFNIRQYIPISPYRDNATTKRILREVWFKRRYESIKEFMNENKLLSVFDLDFFEMFKYLFMELRSDKKNDFLSQIYSQKIGSSSWSKLKGVIKVAKFSTTAKQRSLAVRIVQAFNYLKQNDLIPVNIHEMSKNSCLRLYKQFFQIYLKDNQDLYKLFINFSP